MEDKKECVYCPFYEPIYSLSCQGYASFCSFHNKQINVYEEYKSCEVDLHKIKREYRCPNCDALVLKKLSFTSLHKCSCGATTHISNLKLMFVEV